MELTFFGIVFVIIIVLIAIKRPVYQAIIGGLVALVILFKMPPLDILHQVLNVFVKWDSLSVLVSMYLICVLQKMLSEHDQIRLAQQDLDRLLNNRRTTAAGSAIFIGLLPSAAAMMLCGDIIKSASDGYLDKKEQAFTTSWIRHVPESILPTYPGVLLMLSLSGVAVHHFMLGMLVPVVVIVLLAWFFCLRKIPRETGEAPSTNKRRDLVNLIKHLWSLLLILVLILAMQMQVVFAVLISIVGCFFVYRYKVKDIIPLLIRAFDLKLMINTFVVLILKEFISYTGVLYLLPDVLAKLPVPTFLIFVILFFFGGFISSSTGIIALGTPLAFAAMPDGGMPLIVLLMCISHAASQISPAHVCITVASDYFGINVVDLIKKTLPVTLIFCLLMIGYYLLLNVIM